MSLANKIHLESQLFPKSTDKVVASWIEEAKRIDKLLTERNTQIGVLQTRVAAMQDTINELQRKLIGATVTVQPGWCAQCNMPEEHCRENHGELYAEGCAPE